MGHRRSPRPLGEGTALPTVSAGEVTDVCHRHCHDRAPFRMTAEAVGASDAAMIATSRVMPAAGALLKLC